MFIEILWKCIYDLKSERYVIVEDRIIDEIINFYNLIKFLRKFVMEFDKMFLNFMYKRKCEKE